MATISSNVDILRDVSFVGALLLFEELGSFRAGGISLICVRKKTWIRKLVLQSIIFRVFVKAYGRASSFPFPRIFLRIYSCDIDRGK